MLKVIKTEQDYERALERIEDLMSAVQGAAAVDELEVLATLVEQYEEAQFPIEAPTPIAAIEFRMEQAGLSARDLEPYIGSRSRVSEILSGKRSLSIDMIRNLVRHLNIPAESLLAEEDINSGETAEPSKHVIEKLRAWELMQEEETYPIFLDRVWNRAPVQPMLRATTTERTSSRTDRAALNAWCAGALALSERFPVRTEYRSELITQEWLRWIASLSVEDEGPQKAIEAAADIGIVVVVLEHFDSTYVDGAAIKRDDDVPVVALSIRHDKVDNFWFTLMHELAHVKLHLGRDRRAIFDDLDLAGNSIVEREADELAQNALIPPDLWESAYLDAYASNAEIIGLAKRANVHASVVAGRWQKAHGDYKKFSRLIVRNTLRTLFQERF